MVGYETICPSEPRKGYRRVSIYLDSKGKTRLTSLNVDRPFAESVRRKTERTKKMKKLMIAAAAATLVGGAFAASCNESCTDDCPFGYRLKVMVRTTNPCQVTDDSCGPCGETANYRKPAIRRYMGVVYGTTKADKIIGPCNEATVGCACNTWQDNAYIAIWDYDTKGAMALDSAELFQLNRVGCVSTERNKAEMAFQVNLKCDENVYPLMFAGFGLCGNYNDKITLGQVQGYCAGLIPAGRVAKSACTETGFCSTKMWNLCCNTAIDCAYTAAYGKWTLVWDSDVASKVGINLGATEAKTVWGAAPAVLLADKRFCGAVECVEACKE